MGTDKARTMRLAEPPDLAPLWARPRVNCGAPPSPLLLGYFPLQTPLVGASDIRFVGLARKFYPRSQSLGDSGVIYHFRQWPLVRGTIGMFYLFSGGVRPGSGELSSGHRLNILPLRQIAYARI